MREAPITYEFFDTVETETTHPIYTTNHPNDAHHFFTGRAEERPTTVIVKQGDEILDVRHSDPKRLH